MARYIFITGGVVSSLGKGLAAAALGALLQARGYRVRLRKLDPYLNVDPGTMSPYEHGEVFVDIRPDTLNLDEALLEDALTERTRAIFAAGCDMALHCNGNIEEMRDVAAQTPELSGRALARANAALAARKAPQPFDRAAARTELDALIARANTASA